VAARGYRLSSESLRNILDRFGFVGAVATPVWIEVAVFFRRIELASVRTTERFIQAARYSRDLRPAK
jgi:hypothetical protein